MPAINDPIYSCFNTICKQQHPWSFQCRYHPSPRTDPVDLPIRALFSNVLKRPTFRFNSYDVILKSSTCSFLWTIDPIRLEVYFDKAVKQAFFKPRFLLCSWFWSNLGRADIMESTVSLKKFENFSIDFLLWCKWKLLSLAWSF